MQKLDSETQVKYGFNKFEKLCQDVLKYSSVEQFFLHCGSPQLKIQKHKTTGKGKTKCGEPVYMEQIHEYAGKDTHSNNLRIGFRTQV